VLAAEAIAASVVALVPPMDWVTSLGIGGSWVNAMVGGAAQPLAMAWLGVVGLRSFHQLRGPRTTGSPSASSADADTATHR
jgi:hypothetical protein